jgi:tRNA nucleotidyltransferase (CCA-adding enzyme)
MITEQKLIEKLKLIEALFAGTPEKEEKTAARYAAERIMLRLKEMQNLDPPIEYTFTMSNMWSRKLFVALLRRYGISPYRYYKQRYTTVMARVPKSFVDNVLWPEFEKLDAVLEQYIEEVTNKVISETIHADFSEAEVKETQALPLL